jgi:hypothetical protein
MKPKDLLAMAVGIVIFIAVIAAIIIVAAHYFKTLKSVTGSD